MLLEHLGEPGSDDALAEVSRALDDPLIFEDVEGRKTGGAGERVARVGEAAREGAVDEAVVHGL